MGFVRAITELVARGGPLMVPLLVCSVLVVAVILERAVFFFVVGARTAAFLGRWGGRESAQGLALVRADGRSPLERMLAAGASPSQRNPGAERAMERAAAEEVERMERHLPVLDVSVTVAPLMGLLGTIVGMMNSFGIMSRAGVSQPHAITGGIAQALLTTAVGLTIAIVAFIAYSIFQALVARHVRLLERTAEDVLRSMRPDADQAQTGPAAAG